MQGWEVVRGCGREDGVWGVGCGGAGVRGWGWVGARGVRGGGDGGSAHREPLQTEGDQCRVGDVRIAGAEADLSELDDGGVGDAWSTLVALRRVQCDLVDTRRVAKESPDAPVDAVALRTVGMGRVGSGRVGSGRRGGTRWLM